MSICTDHSFISHTLQYTNLFFEESLITNTIYIFFPLSLVETAATVSYELHEPERTIWTSSKKQGHIQRKHQNL